MVRSAQLLGRAHYSSICGPSASELDAGVAAIACSARLGDPATWPRAGARHVIEVSPAAASKPPPPVGVQARRRKLEPQWMAHWSHCVLRAVALPSPSTHYWARAAEAAFQLEAALVSQPLQTVHYRCHPGVDAAAQSSGACKGPVSAIAVLHVEAQTTAHAQQQLTERLEAQVEIDSSFDPLHWYCRWCSRRI